MQLPQFMFSHTGGKNVQKMKHTSTSNVEQDNKNKDAFTQAKVENNIKIQQQPEQIDSCVQTDIQTQAIQVIETLKPRCSVCGSQIQVVIDTLKQKRKYCGEEQEEHEECESQQNSRISHICLSCLENKTTQKNQLKMRQLMDEANKDIGFNIQLTTGQLNIQSGEAALQLLQNSLVSVKSSCYCQNSYNCTCGCSFPSHDAYCHCSSCLKQPRDQINLQNTNNQVNVYFKKQKENTLAPKYQYNMNLQSLQSEINFLYEEFPFLQQYQTQQHCNSKPHHTSSSKQSPQRNLNQIENEEDEDQIFQQQRQVEHINELTDNNLQKFGKPKQNVNIQQRYHQKYGNSKIDEIQIE